MILSPRTSLLIFIFILVSWLSGILILDFYRTGQENAPELSGYIGVVINPQHDGVQYAQHWVNERLNDIISAEVTRALPHYTENIPTFYRSRTRCHTTLAYLKNNSSTQLATISSGLHLMLHNKPFLQTPFYLSSHLQLSCGFRTSRNDSISQDDTIVMTLHDPHQFLHMLHPYVEATLAHVSNQTHEVLYTPWETIGEFVPHITISRIDFESLKKFVVEHNGDGEAVEYAIRQRVETELLPYFSIPDRLREVPGNSFTLFDGKRQEYETFILRERK